VANGLTFNNAASGGTYVLGGLSGTFNEALTDNSSNPVSLMIGNNNNTGMNYSGVLSGSGSITKVGAGTQTLSGASTYTGSTGVQAGTLVVSGSLSGTSAINVSGGNLEVDGSTNIAATINLSGGGELSGKGTVGPITDPSSIVAPGATVAGGAAGTLSVNGSVTLASTTQFNIGLGVQIATDSDQLAEIGSGTVSLSGATLVLNLGSAYNDTAAVGTFFQILNGGSNSVSGQFAQGTSPFNVTNPYTHLTDTFEAFYNVTSNDTGTPGGDYVDVEELASVPEPGTWATMLGGFGFLVLLQRRRRRRHI